MPLYLKKSLLPDERCLNWVQIEDNSYQSFAKVTGASYFKVTDDNENILWMQGTPMWIFKIGTSLFGMYSLGNNFIISKWNGLFGINISQVWDEIAVFNVSSGETYNAIVTGISRYNNEIYISLFIYKGLSSKSYILKFNGTSISLIRDDDGNHYIYDLCLDDNNGDLYFSLTGLGLSSSVCDIKKITQSGVESNILNTTDSKTVTSLKFFNDELHYVRRSSATYFGFFSVLAKISGGVESIINQTLLRNSDYSRIGVTDTDLWVHIAPGVYDSKNYSYKYDGSLLTFQNQYDRVSGGELLTPYGFFSDLDSELILGVDGSFQSTVPNCDLSFDNPSYIKTNETAEDADDGTITVNAISPFTKQYSINGGSTWQSSNVFSGLAPDNYTITVRDSQGCEISQSGIIIAPFGGAVTPVSGSDVVSVDLKPVNRYNFIQWFRADGTINFRRLECENENWDLPNTYQRTSVREIKHYPVAAIGELFSFYINFTSSFTDPDFNDFRLALIRPTGLLEGHSSIALLNRDIYDGNSYNIYCDAVTIEASVPVGIYRMAIYNSSNGNLIFISNEIEVMRLDSAESETVRMQWSHPYNIYKYYYQNVPDYVHNLRLRINEIERQSEGELTQYRSVSGGDLRNQSFELDMYVVLETNRFDKLAHEAMFVFQAHQTIIINEEQYVLKSLYKTEGGPEMLLKRGRIEFYLQDFSTINRYGSLVDITIIGSEDPLLQGDEGGFIKL